MMVANWATASRMLEASSALSSVCRNSGMGFWGEILVFFGDLPRRESMSRPESGLASLRLRLRLRSFGGT